MKLPKIKDIIPNELTGKALYSDGTTIYIRPLRSKGPGTLPDDLDSLVLYKDSELEAFVVNHPSNYMSEEKNIGFWSKGNVSQEDFFKYWKSASDFASKNTPKDPRSKELYNVLSQYGTEMREQLKDGNAKKYENGMPFKKKID